MEKNEVLRLYRQMLLIRRFEDRAGVAYMQDKVGGYLHLYIGQEAVACGLISVLDPKDAVIDSYRDHGHFIAAGGGINEAMAELYGKDTGCSRGKGGSMHLFSREQRFYGGSGIVGAGIGVGTGLAFAFKYRQQKNVCLSFFGDGACQTGMFHESLNLASLWNLPMIFIIENNQYAMGTSVERSSSETEFYKRAAAYKMHGERIDGMDLFAVREAAERLVPQVRETNRPVLIEALTYRYRGHGAADPGNYRTKEEVEEWRGRDPIGMVEGWLVKQKVLKEKDVEKIHAEVQAEVDECLRFAEESPWPAPEALYEHVYA
ncbi:MAG: pyruvate dehydrogenase (acetyl-transferring) E1 component subunit alpha [Actinomycetota bacterium]